MRFERMPVDGVHDLGSGYVRIVLRADPALEGRPGQFLMVRGDWGRTPLLPRPMSLLRAGHRPEMLVKVVGEGTRRLAEARPDDPLDVLAPLGTWFTPPPSEERPVLVAGGVGVAPLAWWANDLAARPAGPRPLFLFGGRTKNDLPLAEEIEEHTDLRVATEDGSRGAPGLVSVLFDDAIRPGAVVYACGPSPMMAAVAAAAAKAGVRCEVSLEAPMACGYGVCLGCAVSRSTGGYLHVCMDGPVLDATRVAWESAR